MEITWAMVIKILTAIIAILGFLSPMFFLILNMHKDIKVIKSILSLIDFEKVTKTNINSFVTKELEQ